MSDAKRQATIFVPVAKTPRPATDAGISIGKVFLGKYRVEELLGQGGMGIVARCTHLALDEQVAIKMLRPDVLTDEDATSRFMREAQAAVKLRSEYVARVSDVGTFENGVPYMVMEYLDGQDLGVLLEAQHHVNVQWAIDLVLQAAEALAEAHSIGIVHRDVKPTNLFVTWRPDGTSLIKVLDFGISKSPMGTDMQLTQTQSLLGTPAYMSPEQMRSARLVDARTDIWSLGTVMYELIEGRRPFEAESFSEMCVKVAVDAPAPMVNASPELQQVILRCLAKSPEQRYPSMADLGRDLVPFARDPHAAQMMVERMFRMLGRSSGVWDGSSGSGAQPLKSPVPGHIRDLKSGPVARAQTPIPGAPEAADTTLQDRSAPAIVPIDVRPRRRSGLVIGLVATAAIAIGATVMVITNNGRASDEDVQTDTPAVVPDDKPADPPADPTGATAGATTVKPADPPADPPGDPTAAKPADHESSADVVEPAEDTKPAPPKKDPPKKHTNRARPRPTAKKPDKNKPPAETKPEIKPEIKPPPVEPPKKKNPEDLYSKPRPEPRS